MTAINEQIKLVSHFFFIIAIYIRGLLSGWVINYHIPIITQDENETAHWVALWWIFSFLFLFDAAHFRLQYLYWNPILSLILWFDLSCHWLWLWLFFLLEKSFIWFLWDVIHPSVICFPIKFHTCTVSYWKAPILSFMLALFFFFLVLMYFLLHG